MIFVVNKSNWNSKIFNLHIKQLLNGEWGFIKLTLSSWDKVSNYDDDDDENCTTIKSFDFPFYSVLDTYWPSDYVCMFSFAATLLL